MRQVSGDEKLDYKLTNVIFFRKSCALKIEGITDNRMDHESELADMYKVYTDK